MFDAQPFEDVCQALAQRFDNLSVYSLLRYAAEDLYGGYDGGDGEWPIGSMWSVEGRLLYAIMRTLRPTVVVEIGTHAGCSATHIGSALKANGKGRLFTIDTNPNAGAMLAPEVEGYVTRVFADGIDWLHNPPLQPDIIFEDGWHATDDVAAVWQIALDVLSNGGMMISHDAAHWEAGECIRAGIQRGGVDDPLILRPEPSDCGFAFWRKGA